MNLIARQTTSNDDPAQGATSTDLGAAAGSSGLDTTDTAVVDPSLTSAATTAAVPSPDSTVLSTSEATDQTLTSGPSDASISATSTVDSVQPTPSDATSGVDSAQTASGSQTSLVSPTDSSLISTQSDSQSVPSTTIETTSTPSSTTTSDSTSSISSTRPSDSSSSQSITDSSSSRSSTTDASTSLTTSFTEIVSTINGQVTTVVSPVATLNADTSSSVTSSNRTAVIAGGTVAGISIIILCLLAVFLFRRHQKRRLVQSHRYLPTPRSVMLAGEDDFDLAGPSQPRRGFGIFGSHRRNSGDGVDDYRDLGSDSGRDVNSPVMRELPSEPPPRLLRPVASKTGSYFQEAVWPPPDEGSRLADPLMAASNVDLHSIVNEVMGPQGQNRSDPRQLSNEASSSSSLPEPARLRGGAADSSSLFSESGTPTDFGPLMPSIRHGEPPTMSSIESGLSESRSHLRDWSTDSATGLLSSMDRSTRRSSGVSGSGSGSGSSPWLPPGAAPPSAYTYSHPYARATSLTLSSPLRVVTEPRQSFTSLPSSRARQKANEAAQERRGSLAIANPSPPERDEGRSEGAPSSIHSSSLSLSVSTSSIQRLRSLTSTRSGSGSVEASGTGAETPYPDESPIERRSIPPSLAHAWLLDIDEEEDAALTTPRPGPREEIPPRYDMIRRDSEDSVTRTRSL
ncbi:hypothetical protein A7U60_g7942 [Sanghuangporus baumii]|uniref:Uncharacterized protein n=1 Tax=Sanghuangporus baumii TaxID=108892 RepID=A0A9Q5HS44_SANBA|nr:hypothetical protein A7U60_g7942 [Sanghuangporus baumii]